jgi:PQQ system protein
MTSTAQERSAVLTEIGLDRQNKASLGRLLASGNIGHAEEAADGSMRAEVRIPPDKLIWDPSVLVMPHGGDIEIKFFNDDTNTHCALLPCNGESRWIWLPV